MQNSGDALNTLIRTFTIAGESSCSFSRPCFDPLGPGGFAALEFVKEVTVCDGQSIGQPTGF